LNPLISQRFSIHCDRDHRDFVTVVTAGGTPDPHIRFIEQRGAIARTE